MAAQDLPHRDILPPEIPPEDTDWTWVIERPCPECGFDGPSLDVTAMGAEIRANAAQWAKLLDDPEVRTRPSPTTWSALEYAAHVRDVFLLYRERLRLMIEFDDPLYPNWDQDQTAVEQRYDLADPAVVATELTDAAAALADAFEALGPADWARPGRRSDGSSFTVETFARYLLHDPTHHLVDVRSGLARLGSGESFI